MPPWALDAMAPPADARVHPAPPPGAPEELPPRRTGSVSGSVSLGVLEAPKNRWFI